MQEAKEGMQQAKGRHARSEREACPTGMQEVKGRHAPRKREACKKGREVCRMPKGDMQEAKGRPPRNEMRKPEGGIQELKGRHAGGKGRHAGSERQACKADLRAHEDEAKGVDSPHKGVEHKAVPALVGFVYQGPPRITHQNWVQHIAEVADGISVMPLGLAGTVVACHATPFCQQGQSHKQFGKKNIRGKNEIQTYITKCDQFGKKLKGKLTSVCRLKTYSMIKHIC